ncbi:MAG: hypothetical protein NT130_05515 [Candidatus Micrarchaeota archaeon]|nr:hypothetical protein [Candidatus Micrarchaeota archaeon]
MFEAAIAMSRKWDATDAGQEIGEQIISKLKNKPKFVLLFSTIHYEKHGGFQKFLDAVNSKLPERTPVVGGTVAGFMNNYGCYTRGASALAVYSDEMDVAVGVGNNTRENPKKATLASSSEILDKMKNSKYATGCAINLYSSAVVGEYPIVGRRVVIDNKQLTRFPDVMYDISLKVFHRGVDRADEMLPVLSKELSNFQQISGGCTDTTDQLSNYLFFGRQTITNALLTLAFKTSLNASVKTTFGFKETGTKMLVTKFGRDHRIIKSINGRPAREELLRILGWPKAYLNERVFSKLFYYPIGFVNQSGVLIPQVFGLFLGESIVVPYSIQNPEITLLSSSGKDLISSVDEHVEQCKKIKPLFSIFISCATIIVTLGAHIYEIWEKINSVYGNTPYLVGYVAGESTFSSNKELKYGNHTFNSLVLWG